ncbi:MAG: hypothetical protein R2867_01335 [Caldilineaceae bacterium]
MSLDGLLDEDEAATFEQYVTAYGSCAPMAGMANHRIGKYVQSRTAMPPPILWIALKSISYNRNDVSGYGKCQDWAW